MLTVSRPQRQLVMTLSILAFLVTPTLGVAFSAWRLNRPTHRLAVASMLSEQLDLNISVGPVTYGTPNQTFVEDLVIRRSVATEPDSPQSLVELGRFEELGLTQESDQLILRAEGDLTLRSISPRQGVKLLESITERLAIRDYDRIAFSAPKCSILNGSDVSLELIDLALLYECQEREPKISASFRLLLPDSDKPCRCELTFNRDLSGEEPVTSVTLETIDDLPIPALALNLLIDSERWLGTEARVVGHIELSKSDESTEWDLEVKGLLTDVDLRSLVTRHFPNQKINGSAQITIEEAKWGPSPGRSGAGWHRVAGRFEAGEGSIGIDLLEALQREMGIRLHERSIQAEDMSGNRNELKVEFDRIGFDFAFEPNGEIQLGRILDSFSPGAIILSAGTLEPIALVPNRSPNWVGLYRALTTGQNLENDPVEQIPHSPERWILDYLPSGISPRESKTTDLNNFF